MADLNPNPIAGATPTATATPPAPAATPAVVVNEPAAGAPAGGEPGKTVAAQAAADAAAAAAAAKGGEPAPAGDPPPEGGEPTPPVEGDPQSKVPDKYAITRPENSYLGDGAEEKIALIAKERGLSNEEAQSLLNEHSSVLSSYVDGQLEAHDATMKSWVQEVTNDREIGGSNLEATKKLVGRVLNTFATKEFTDLLETSGYGDNPHVLKTLSRIGRAMSEPQLANAGATVGSAPPKELAERLFGEGTEVK